MTPVWYLYFYIYFGASVPVEVPGQYRTEQECVDVAKRNELRFVQYKGQWRERSGSEFFCIEGR